MTPVQSRWLLPLVFLLPSCEVTHEKKHEQKNESYSYQLSLNGCDTGKHTFSTKGEYCSGLADDELNHGCAGEMRLEKLKKECDLEPVEQENVRDQSNEKPSDDGSNTGGGNSSGGGSSGGLSIGTLYGYRTCVSSIVSTQSSSGQTLYDVTKYCTPLFQDATVTGLSQKLDADVEAHCPQTFSVSIGTGPFGPTCTATRSPAYGSSGNVQADIQANLGAEQSCGIAQRRASLGGFADVTCQ